MAYCGILDGLSMIDGKPVDLSRLEDGIIIAGDEEYDADDLITEEDKLDLFNENALRTKADILKGIDSLLEKIKKASKEKQKHSQEYYSRCRELVKQFRKKVEKYTFPEKLEDWWEYDFDVRSTGITLKLQHTDYFSVYEDDTVVADVDTSFELFRIRTKLLTVEQYAKANEVTTTTVRQWIRRGKIRTAIKQGSEWRIPELAEVMERGYQPGFYERKEYLTDLPAEYAFFNEFDNVDISQNEENRNVFDLCFSKSLDSEKDPESEQDQSEKEIQLDKKEREKFELYLISSPFVESTDSYISF